MKKLLLKLFPNYFNVTIIHDFTKVDVKGHPFKLAIVEPDSDKIFASLGIEEDRLDYLFSEIKNAMSKSNCKLQVLNMLESKIKHVNEFYALVIMLERLSNYGPQDMLAMYIGGILNKGRDSK